MNGYRVRLADDSRGGYAVLSIDCVHAYSCPYWRIGRRHGPCNCGACGLWLHAATQREVERAEKKYGPMP